MHIVCSVDKTQFLRKSNTIFKQVWFWRLIIEKPKTKIKIKQSGLYGGLILWETCTYWQRSMSWKWMKQHICAFHSIITHVMKRFVRWRHKIIQCINFTIHWTGVANQYDFITKRSLESRKHIIFRYDEIIVTYMELIYINTSKHCNTNTNTNSRHVTHALPFVSGPWFLCAPCVRWAPCNATVQWNVVHRCTMYI